MDVKIQISPSISKKNNGSKYTFLNEISSDVLFALSLPIYLADHGKDNNFTAKLRAVQQQDDTVPSDYVDVRAEFCELFESFDQDGDVAKICKQSKMSKAGHDLYDVMNTFGRLVGDYNVDEDEERIALMKRASKETESYKTDIALFEGKMQKMAIEYDEQFREYEKEKKYYDKQVENAYQEAHFYKVRLESKNKQEMLLYYHNLDSKVTDLEKRTEVLQRKYVVSKDNNIVESEELRKILLKKGLMLKTIIDDYNNDMLMRYEKKTNLQQTIKSTMKSFEALEEKITSMGIYLEELIEEERVYLKREFYDKLDAIKEKIALRAINKFLVPYILNKFGPRKKPKNKTKK